MIQNQHNHQQQQPPAPPPPQTAALTPSPSPSTEDTTTEAPPKQVAMAMDRLGQAARVIADIRLGADRLLEALFVSAESHQSSKILNLILKEDSAMQQHLNDLRSIGRQLESCGVLTEALRSRGNSWGLHIPLVCPDGAVVAYAWKRQLAGQAGASAVDRTRLALKSFMDQKRRFFPHLDSESASKKQRISQECLAEELSENYKTLADIQRYVEKEVPNMKVATYERLQWLKRASLLPASANEGSYDTSMEHDHVGNNLIRDGSVDDSALDKVGVIELLIPSVFRAVVSLHPVGSTDPDAVAFFSPDEGGRHVHARGLSVYHVYRHITELSNTALQYFLEHKPEMALYYLLLWVSGYQNLFAQACSKCGRLFSMDKQSALFLPPVLRPYRELFAVKTTSTSPRNPSSNTIQAYHVSCAPHDV